jgi:hypothetical protein
MRIEDFLNQSISAKQLNSYRKQPEAATFSLPERNDAVSISQEAREAQQSGGGYFTRTQEASEAKLAFKSYMDQATGRVPSAPKTPEEKLKELTEKLKKLQTQLSDVMADGSLSDQVRTNRMETLNAQINQVHAQMSEVAKEVGEQAEA